MAVPTYITDIIHFLAEKDAIGFDQVDVPADRVLGTFGKSAIGASETTSGVNDRAFVVLSTATATGGLTKISVYCRMDAAQSINLKPVVWDGVTKAVLSIGTPILVDDAVNQWRDLEFDSPITVTSGSSYYIGVITGNNTGTFRMKYDADSVNDGVDVNNYASPVTLTALETANRTHSIEAEITDINEVLDDLVLDFLMTPDNGFLPSEEVDTFSSDEVCNYEYAGADATSGDVILPYPVDSTTFAFYNLECVDTTTTLTTVIDSTSPDITVLEWKETYLEETYQDMHNDQKEIGFGDSNSPNYPLIDFKGNFYDFDTTTSQDYAISPDTTTDIFIQFEYPKAEKIDGMYFQGGINGVDDYGSLTDHNIIAFYLAYSHDEVTWHYIHQDDTLQYLTDTYTDTTALNVIQSIVLTTDQQSAIDDPLWYDQEFPIEDETVIPFKFPLSIEARFWRIFPIDLETFLDHIGEGAGYTGYTASFSHLRFEQYKQHAEELVRESVSVATVDPILFTAGVIFETENIAAPALSQVGNLFVFANDDGYSGFSGFLSMTCESSVQNVAATFRLEVSHPTGASGGWVTLRSITTPGLAGQDNKAVLASAWSEVPRIEGQAARKFRVIVSSSATADYDVEGDALVIYKAGANIVGNWPNKP